MTGSTTVKLDSAGARQWIKDWGGEEIVVDHNGNVMVADNTTIVSYSRGGDQRWVTTRPSGKSGIVLKRAPDNDARQSVAAFPVPPATITNVLVDKEGNTIVGYRGGGRSNDTYGAVKYSDSGAVSWAAFGVVPPYAIALDQHDHLCFTGGYGDIITVSYDLGAPLAIGSQASIPREYELYQNYPNPFNPSTTIRYQVPSASNVTLKVFDLLGRELALLVNERKNPGTYEVQFDGSKLSSGVYFYRMSALPLAGRDLVPANGRDGTAGRFSQTRKMMLLK